MGGDDLGSDDEYLTGNVVDDQDDFLFLDKNKSVLEASTVAVMEDNDDDNAQKKKQKKRSRTTNDTSSDHEDTNTTNNNHEDAALTKKKKTTQTAPPSASRNKLLLEVGRTIQDQPADKQASYLWTMLMHHHQLQSGQNDDNSTGDKEEVPLKPQLQACHFQASTTSTTESTTITMQARLRACIPSMKQLKTWNRKQSPMIIIVCLSARRAVQVLKDIASLKIRAVKLFAKHLSVEQQTSWLATGASGIAVGTPHRLSVLCAKQALRLTHTRLIVLDAHQDAKQFTVCTLPDTAPHCMEWLRDYVLPVMEQRGPKELKLAFC